MLISKNDEEKRSKAWRIVMITATVVIIIVGVFFIGRGFLGNPLAGTWEHDESDMTLKINSGGKAVLVWNNLFEGKELTVNLEYTLDKSDKQITFKAAQEELERASEEIGDDVTSAEVESAISSLITSFHYSVDGTELTMTEWDYGDQLFFTKII